MRIFRQQHTEHTFFSPRRRKREENKAHARTREGLLFFPRGMIGNRVCFVCLYVHPHLERRNYHDKQTSGKEHREHPAASRGRRGRPVPEVGLPRTQGSAGPDAPPSPAASSPLWNSSAPVPRSRRAACRIGGGSGWLSSASPATRSTTNTKRSSWSQTSAPRASGGKRKRKRL